MKQTKKPDDTRLQHHLAMRATDRDLARLDALAKSMGERWMLRSGPLLRTEVLRLAVHKGLQLLELEEQELKDVKINYDEK